MEVLLRQRIEKLGERGEIVRVADGYARNYLIPQGLAMLATKGVRKQAESMTRAETRRESLRRDQAMTERGALDGKAVTVRARANELGHLFGSVGVREIAEALHETHGVQLDPTKLHLAEPIREAGEFAVEAHVYGDITATITVTVKALEEAAKPKREESDEDDEVTGTPKPKPIITREAEADA